MQKYILVAALALVFQLVASVASSTDDHWTWRSYSRKERAFRDKDIGYNGHLHDSYESKVRREPTTRRPLPGEPENEDIEDYVDTVPTVPSTPNVATRQYNPYGNGYPFGFNGQPTNVGNFGGPSGFGGGNPGGLLGSGVHTGGVGGQALYPNAYQPGFGGFGSSQNGLGQVGYPGAYLGTGFGGSAYPAFNTGSYYGGYPGGPSAAGQLQGQFPGAGSQYPYAPYSGGTANYNGNQFAGAAGQYPGLGQYTPNQFNVPQFPGGYGPGPGGYGNSFPGGNFRYDEKSLLGSSAGAGAGGGADAQGKSAKTVTITPASVNDKLTKKV